MFLKSAVIFLLVEYSIGFSLFSGNNNKNQPIVSEPSNPSDGVPNFNFNFVCKCNMKGSPPPPKPEEPTVPQQPETVPEQPSNPNLPQVPTPTDPAQPLPQVAQPNAPSKPLFPLPNMPMSLGDNKLIPLDPTAPKVPDTLPNLPNPNLPKPPVLPGGSDVQVMPQPFGPFQPFQPFQPSQPFQPFPGPALPGQQSIPNLDQLGSLLQTLTGLDCTCSGGMSPNQPQPQPTWSLFSSKFPFWSN